MGRRAAVRRVRASASSSDVVDGRGTACSSRPSSPSATPATSAPATAATCSSPTSRRARAGCATCRRCSGSAASSTGSRMPAELVAHGVLTQATLRQLRQGAPLPLGRALPSALPGRPRRGAPDLRPAARDRAPHGLSRPQGVEQRRALHEALLPGRQGGRRADPDLLRRARGAAPAPAAPRPRPLRPRPPAGRRHGDRGRPDRAGRRPICSSASRSPCCGCSSSPRSATSTSIPRPGARSPRACGGSTPSCARTLRPTRCSWRC